MNPQSLNRYSYCLNNPLKYVDPTGFWGESLGQPDRDGAFGWTSTEGDLVSKGGSWQPIDNSSVDTLIDLFYASNARDIQNFVAAVLPEILDRGTGTDNFMAAGKATINGQTYYWGTTHKYDRSRDIRGESRNMSQLTLMPFTEMSRGDWIIMCDTIAFTGDAIPIFTGCGFIAGYGISVIASTASFTLTVFNYAEAKIDRNDMMRALVNYATGFIPNYGVIPAGIQTGIDIYNR